MRNFLFYTADQVLCCVSGLKRIGFQTHHSFYRFEKINLTIVRISSLKHYKKYLLKKKIQDDVKEDMFDISNVRN